MHACVFVGFLLFCFAFQQNSIYFLCFTKSYSRVISGCSAWWKVWEKMKLIGFVLHWPCDSQVEVNGAYKAWQMWKNLVRTRCPMRKFLQEGWPAEHDSLHWSIGYSYGYKKQNMITCTNDFISPKMVICLFVGCLTSQQQASVSQGRICSDNFTCCHTWDRSCRSNVLPHPVTVYWHRANQSQSWPYNARRLAG